jgi:hypothetical protein
LVLHSSLQGIQEHATISSATEGKEVLAAKGVGLGVEVGESGGEEGRTTIAVLDGVKGRKTAVVLG